MLKRLKMGAFRRNFEEFSFEDYTWWSKHHINEEPDEDEVCVAIETS